MRFDFSNLCTLRDTLRHLMGHYEEDEKVFRQFYDAVATKTLCPCPIGPVRIYDGTDAVLEYIRWFYATTPSVSLDDCTDALYLRLEDKISCSYGEQIDLPTICHVLTIVDDLFSFSQKLHPISISIIDTEMDGRNGESIAVFGDDSCSGAIFLYRMWNDFGGRFTPATVLLHELGHQLHFHLTENFAGFQKAFMHSSVSLVLTIQMRVMRICLNCLQTHFFSPSSIKRKNLAIRFPKYPKKSRNIAIPISATFYRQNNLFAPVPQPARGFLFPEGSKSARLPTYH